MKHPAAEKPLNAQEIEKLNADMQKAVINILEDFTIENEASEETQKALLNILDDFKIEREASEDTQKAVLNILDDFKIEREASEDTQKAVLNILDDFNLEKIKTESINEELAVINGEMESFSYSISHDLRAPLRAINGYAKILTEDYSLALDTEGLRLLEVIHQNATRMGTLIDDLLAFSRLGRKKINKTLVNMNELVERLVSETNKTSPNNAKLIINSLHPIMADYSLINQVMTNLFSNAVKYSSKKSNPVIEINSVLEGDAVTYSIRDNGAGFNMRFVNKLFGVFQRLHTLEDFEGTGVGLAIVNRIITKHGGRVWAEGEMNNGAVFSFSLPEYKNFKD